MTNPLPSQAMPAKPLAFAEDAFHFYLPTQIYFGAGKRYLIGELVAQLGKRPLVVAGSRVAQQAAWFEQLMKRLYDAELRPQIFNNVEPDPTDETVLRGAQAIAEHQADCVIAVGGGSVMDAAKAMALVALHGGSPLDYAGKETQLAMLPLLCVPTTAGTGSEVTKYAVIRDAQTAKKVTIKNQKGFPTIALVDPDLTTSMPPYVTVCTGVDASIHALEAYLSLESNWMMDALALNVLQRVFADLPRVLANPDDLALRTSLQYAAMLGGIIINNVRTGVIHTMGNHLGAMAHLPHGHSLAVLTIPSLRFNAPACLEKLAQLQAALNLPGANPLEAVVAGFESLFALGNLNRFSAPAPITSQQVATMTENVCRDARLFEINPMPLAAHDIEQLYAEVLAHAFDR